MATPRLKSGAAGEELTQRGRESASVCNGEGTRFGMLALSAKALLDIHGLGPAADYPLNLRQCGGSGHSSLRLVVDSLDPPKPGLA